MVQHVRLDRIRVHADDAWPSAARQTAETAPTYPRPRMLILIMCSHGSFRTVTEAWPRPTRPLPTSVTAGTRAPKAGEYQPAGGSVPPHSAPVQLVGQGQRGCRACRSAGHPGPHGRPLAARDGRTQVKARWQSCFPRSPGSPRCPAGRPPVQPDTSVVHGRGREAAVSVVDGPPLGKAPSVPSPVRAAPGLPRPEERTPRPTGRPRRPRECCEPSWSGTRTAMSARPVAVGSRVREYVDPATPDSVSRASAWACAAIGGSRAGRGRPGTRFRRPTVAVADNDSCVREHRRPDGGPPARHGGRSQVRSQSRADIVSRARGPPRLPPEQPLTGGQQRGPSVVVGGRGADHGRRRRRPGGVAGDERPPRRLARPSWRQGPPHLFP